ncbi:M55 family metallopeptidase [Saliphagus sp. LR7]|uniref:M55 family metallopeptidase n=1 Tax=Saliphagus sp. LR7 TaxID=2282654 RepID=UPI000DF8092E|nr:M55 family metallopeptidase [Saliphagus sp. LR7]
MGTQYFIVTDIEGVAGIDSFETTRTTDEATKAPAMDQLAREVAAAVEGIRSVHPDATVDVWDGHGTGGLRAADVTEATYLADGKPYFDIEGYDGVLFVGQHAMAGTIGAPLCHTYSSRDVAHYRLNDVLIGEFGARALVAGRQGVPTIYLSGDNKAALEARMFVPKIVTTAVKSGEGRQAATHLDRREACEAIRADVASAVECSMEPDPFNTLAPPYTLEIRFRDSIPDEAIDDRWGDDDVTVTRVDDRTVHIESDAIDDLPL